MGGPVIEEPKKSYEEIIAGAIAAGQNQKPHFVLWAVENPSPYGLFYTDRSDVDNICYLVSAGVIERFPYSLMTLERGSVAFYRYEDREAALEDALSRLAKVDRRCFFCHGACHPSSGCQYSEHCVVCGRCTREFASWVQQFTHGKGLRATSKYPDCPSFYEAAGKFIGYDNRNLPEAPYVIARDPYDSLGFLLT